MSVLTAENVKQVEEQLVNDGLISRDKFKQIKKKAAKNNQPLFTLLVSEGQVSNEALTKTIAKVNKVPYVNLINAKVDKKVLRLLPKELAEQYMAVPLGQIQRRLVVGMLDAGNVQAVDFLSSRIGRPLKVYAASEEGIRNVISQYGEDVSAKVSKAISTGAAEESAAEEGEERVESESSKKIKTIVQDSPISKALSAILEYATRNRASDVHVEPLEKEVRIRCRIDGVLREIMRLPKSTEPPLISRIKILSTLKIDEHRVPQDGSFTVKVGDKAVDLRIAISPTIWGEQAIIRLLDKSGTTMRLPEMGYRGNTVKTIRRGLAQPNGMILTSGPTGSGKSTSMYAMLQEVIDDSIKIITLEDPVEYKISGVNQIQVNSDVGLTFASGLRSILRQDPDVILVGEIRDKETANLAVQAALTGHLVFSTLHTNSAAGILPRLLDMGVEPFLIASTVRTVIGQRLVRRNDEQTKKPYQASVTEKKAIQEAVGHLLPESEAERKKASTELGYSHEGLPLRGQNAYTLYKGRDTPDSPGGYSGRIGLYEVFEVTEPIQQLILDHATAAQIQKEAVKQGMITMRQDGYFKALASYTTLEEVNRVVAAG